MNLQPESVVLLTGASSGIGLALATMLHSTTHRVVVTARKQSLHILNDVGLTSSERFLHIPLDVTNAGERRDAVDAAMKAFGRIDVLVNNAGVSYRAVFEHMSRHDDYHQANTNFFGPMELTRLVIPIMRNQGGGRIINVSSVGGMMSMPTMSAYSASKFALEGASEALWYEMKPWNIKVSLVQPGFVRSNAFERVYMTEKYLLQQKTNNPYEEYYHFMSAFIERIMKMTWSTPESIAGVILKTMQRHSPPLRVPATVDARIFSFIRRLLPRSIYHGLLYRFLPGIQHWGRNDKQAESAHSRPFAKSYVQF